MTELWMINTQAQAPAEDRLQSRVLQLATGFLERRAGAERQNRAPRHETVTTAVVGSLRPAAPMVCAV